MEEDAASAAEAPAAIVAATNKPPPPQPPWPSSRYAFMIGVFVEDVILWRRWGVALTLMVGPLVAPMLFRLCRYTFLSLMAACLLLLLSILFLWSKTAQLLNRRAPPIPDKQVSKQVVNKIVEVFRSILEMLLLVFYDVALGRDTNLFYRVFLLLLAISILGSMTDFLTFCYASLVAALTVPVLYKRYEDWIDRIARLIYIELRMYERIYERVTIKYLNRTGTWISDVVDEN